MATKTFVASEVLTASDTNTYLANSGLVYVKSQTVGSAVSTVAVSNAFNATFDNYLITYTSGTQTVDTNIKMQLGSATTNYYGVMIYSSFLGGSINNASQNNAAQWDFAGGGNSSLSTIHCEVLAPFLSIPTHLSSFIRYSTVYGRNVGYQGDSTSFTAFTVFPSAGTLTGGTITVYGYRKG